MFSDFTKKIIPSIESTENKTALAKKPNHNFRDLNSLTTNEGKLVIDIYQTPEEIVVISTIAGVNPENLDISVNNETLIIKGERKNEKEIKNEDYFYRECYYGKFSRTIILPQDVDAEKSMASFKNGILTIHLPKLAMQKSKEHKIEFK